MTDLKLTFACGAYDRMEALRDGRVAPDGIDLEYLSIQAPRVIFDRMVKFHEFDVSELSASEFISMTGAGQCPFVAIPVFPSKAFRHGFTCVNRKSGIRTPKDLEGKRVGVPLYTQTAAIWVRGHMKEDDGVDLDTITWVQGAIEKGGSHGDPGALPLLKPARIEVNQTGRALEDLLADGAIDATIGSRLPDTLGRHPDVVRLFPDFRGVEADFYRRTRIHPIMHLVAIRNDRYEADPWIAPALYRAFEDAKRIALDELRFSGAQKAMLPFLYADLAEIDDLFPGGDPWPYGIEPNRPTLEALVRHMVDQDFIPESIPVDDLFVPVD